MPAPLEEAVDPVADEPPPPAPPPPVPGSHDVMYPPPAPTTDGRSITRPVD